MIYIPNLCHKPQLNLAAEEYILNTLRLEQRVLFFFVNEPAIIIGRNQNSSEEVDTVYVKEHSIHVVRRLSGGGAVYHDYGNLCYSFILPGSLGRTPDFRAFTLPVIKALNHLGIAAELSGRNDITVNGAKISGNAYYSNENGSVCHGTLLFDTDLSVLSKALHPNPEKLSGKGVQSVRSRVTNLKPMLPQVRDVSELQQQLLDQISSEADHFEVVELNDADRDNIGRIAASRYSLDSWNYGSSPLFNLRRRKQFSFGGLDVRIFMEKGKIRAVKLFGDFFSDRDPALIENALTGAAFEADSLRERLQSVPLESVLPALTVDEAIDFLLAKERVG